MAPLEQVMGIEPTFSAWKADVLAVVRQPHNSVYYTCPQGDLSSLFAKLSAEGEKVIQYIVEYL